MFNEVNRPLSDFEKLMVAYDRIEFLENKLSELQKELCEVTAKWASAQELAYQRQISMLLNSKE